MASGSSKNDVGVVTKGNQLRRNWAKKDVEGNPLLLKAEIDSLGVHPQNRGGVYPSAVQCIELLQPIFKGGFSKEEAQKQFVVVEAGTRDVVSGVSFNKNVFEG